MARQKNNKQPNGRPPIAAMTDLQRYAKRKILNSMEPHIKGVIEKLVELSGGTVAAEEGSKEVFDKKSSKMPPTVQHSACKTFLDMYLNTSKLVYGADKDGKVSSSDEDEDDDKPNSDKPQLSLVVPISKD